jgi:hypothetical protein
MALHKARFLPLLVCIFAAGILARAMCPIDMVIIKGRIEHIPPNARVRAQLLFGPHKIVGDVGETIPDGSDFKIPIDFVTQSRRPLVDGLGEKCGRKPEAVVVILLGGDPAREYEHVTLDLHDDFREVPPGTYALKSEIVFKGEG